MGKSGTGKPYPPRWIMMLLNAHRMKTLPSRLDCRDLAWLTASGVVPAGLPPLPARPARSG